jgi:hypothetical protein
MPIPSKLLSRNKSRSRETIRFASLWSHSGNPESFREFGTILLLETVAALGRGCRLPPRISGLPTVRPLLHALGTRVALLNGEEG